VGSQLLCFILRPSQNAATTTAPLVLTVLLISPKAQPRGHVTLHSLCVNTTLPFKERLKSCPE
jgi:hypothetical protein